MPTAPQTFHQRFRGGRKQAYRDYNRERMSDPRRRRIEMMRKSKRWQRLRVMKLNRDPLCEECAKQKKTTPAKDVHHILGARTHPDLFFSMPNLMSLCRSCHNRIEAELRRG